MPSGKGFDDAVNELKGLSERKSIIGEAAKYAEVLYIAPLQLGMCVPSGCSTHDVNEFGKLIESYIDFDVSATHCDVKMKNDYPPVVIFVICGFSSLVVLALIGSVIDLYCHHKSRDLQNIAMRVLLAFSLFANFKKFKNTSVSDDTLTCLNGIRFITMTWIVLSHTYLISALQFSNLLVVKESFKDFFYQVILNGTVAVDTFFCIGGLLVCYLTIKKIREGGKSLNIRLYIFHRLWRIFPVYVCALGLVFLLNLMGSGPIWHDIMHKPVNNCYRNWWMTLLFMNNLYDTRNSCLMHGWFVACDMQLYIAALIVLLPLMRWPKIGLSIAASGIIACMLFSGVWTYSKNYPPTLIIAPTDPENMWNILTDYYFKPFPHAGPYCVGMIAGYVLATRPKLRMSKPVLVAGWCLAIIINMSVLFGTLKWHEGHDPAFWETMFYSACHRTAWAVGIAWLVTCCATGHADIVNQILSWKIFVPLARLTFVAYLLHPLIQFIHLASSRAQTYPQHHVVVWRYFGHLCVTYGLSFFGTLLIEAPFLQLEKLMTIHKRGQKDPLATFKQNGDFNNSLQINGLSGTTSVLPIDHNIVNGSESKTVVYKL